MPDPPSNSDAVPAYELFPKGELVGGRYRITRFIARGGMGLVYEAKDIDLGDSLALKVLKPEVARHMTNLKRFRREIRLARKVTHPNVCRIYDAGVHSEGEGTFELHFLTMELLHGETLGKLLRREGVLPPEQAQQIVCQIARGLHAAHAVGVVHRDLKSANIILEPTSSGTRSVITDFGLARSLVPDGTTPNPKLTTTGQLMGTPAYFAPELLEGQRLTPSSDIYSLGILIYEMVTGKLPYVGRTPFLTALKRLREPYPDPRVYVPDLDLAWVEVIDQCLERKPEKRILPRQIIERLLGTGAFEVEALEASGEMPLEETGSVEGEEEGEGDPRNEPKPPDVNLEEPPSEHEDEPTRKIHLVPSWMWVLGVVLVVLVLAALLRAL